jgi:hypothetical protein
MKNLWASASFLALLAGPIMLLGGEGCDDGMELSDAATYTAIRDTIGDWAHDELHETVYITIADTGRDYHALDAMMYDLEERLLATIDTMGRYYDEARDSLVLPMDDEDEMWAGDYAPRRGEGSELSLEYLSWYTDRAAPNTFAFFTGLWHSRAIADSAVAAQRHTAPRAFVLETSIYIGCMH